MSRKTRCRSMRRLGIFLAVLVSCSISAGVRAQSGFDSNGQCVGDADGDGTVAINEIIIAVNNALNGCGFVPITLQFRATVGEETFACGNLYHNVGTTKADIVPSDFRFYIYNVRLVTRTGQVVPLKLDQDHTWQLDDLALLDFENKQTPCGNGTTATNTTVHGMAPPADYTGVRFQLGLPFDRNHGNQAIAPSPLDLTGMFWSWQDGYRFLKIDTAFDNVRVHLGSTGCVLGSHANVVTSCARLNIAASVPARPRRPTRSRSVRATGISRAVQAPRARKSISQALRAPWPRRSPAGSRTPATSASPIRALKYPTSSGLMTA